MKLKTFLILGLLIAGFSASFGFNYEETGNNWDSSVAVRNSTCYSGEDLGIRDHQTYLQDQEDKRYGINFSGYFKTPTPCYKLEIDVEEIQENVYEIDMLPVEDLKDGEVCIECVGVLEYDAEFRSRNEFELKILHSGEHVETFNIYEDKNDEPKIPSENVSFLRTIISWLMGLF